MKILRFNVRHNLLFFRITSDLVPFASHPICRFSWQEHFEEHFESIGDFIQGNSMRVSMHPDPFIVINSLANKVFENSVRELAYHVQVLGLMELDTTAKVQIHIGGIYGDKERSMKRFVDRFERLDEAIRRRLVIENDDKRYTLHDCLQINEETGIPVLFDVFHHELNNSGETTRQAFELFTRTWKEDDSLPMVDYSSQRENSLKGKHIKSIDLQHFRSFLDETKPFDFDVMLEIKDKEKSALEALKVASRDDRFLVQKEKWSD